MKKKPDENLQAFAEMLTECGSSKEELFKAALAWGVTGRRRTAEIRPGDREWMTGMLKMFAAAPLTDPDAARRVANDLVSRAMITKETAFVSAMALAMTFAGLLPEKGKDRWMGELVDRFRDLPQEEPMPMPRSVGGVQ
jgi:hypothetical protein